MQCLRDELLARAALAADQHGEIRLRDLLDGLEDASHGRTGSDQLIESVVTLELLAKHPILALEAMSLETAGDDDSQLVIVEGLRNVIVGAALHGFDRDLLDCRAR